VATAPSIDEVFPKFLEFVGPSWLIAQNAKFDMSFVMKYLVQFKMKRDLEVYDTIHFSRRAFPQENRHNLDVISQRLGLEILAEERHRSIGDVKLTAKAFIKMKEMLGTNCPGREKYSV
jgi:DNA polymerase-3 subunit epsilon